MRPRVGRLGRAPTGRARRMSLQFALVFLSHCEDMDASTSEATSRAALTSLENALAMISLAWLLVDQSGCESADPTAA